MFEQHPVPQQISSYQFRLVGDMTLKQFFQLAAGAVVALIIYSLPLPGFLKWPFVLIAAIGGAAFAFLPIQDRPLEKWLAAFFRAIYAPTVYVWKKRTKPPVYFQQTPGAAQAPLPQEPPADSTIHPNQSTAKLEEDEEDYLERIQTMFQHEGAQAQAPEPTVEPTPQQVPEPEPEPQGRVTKEIKVDTQKSEPVEVKPSTPEQKQVEVKPKGFDVPQNTEPVKTENVNQTLSEQKPDEGAQAAQFSQDAAPPLPPTQPNIIVGQVIDPEGGIADGAILEIKDEQGRSVRALKSNKAGHFLIVTPLPDGKYTIFTEKEGMHFKPVNIEVKGEIISPIAIRADSQK